MLSFFARRKGQCFDKLSTSGEGGVFYDIGVRPVLARQSNCLLASYGVTGKEAGWFEEEVA